MIPISFDIFVRLLDHLVYIYVLQVLLFQLNFIPTHLLVNIFHVIFMFHIHYACQNMGFM